MKELIPSRWCCLIVCDPLNTLFVNKERQDYWLQVLVLRLSRSQTTPGRRTERRKDDTGVYHFSCLSPSFDRTEKNIPVTRVGVLDLWRVSGMEDYIGVTHNSTVVYLKPPYVIKSGKKVWLFSYRLVTESNTPETGSTGSLNGYYRHLNLSKV